MADQTPVPAPPSPQGNLTTRSRFRLHLLLSGLLGLLACAGLAALCLVLAQGKIPPLLSAFPLIVALLALMMGAFSIAEIPLMVFAMRRLALERPSNRWTVLGLNALFVFFASVYAAPLLLLASSPLWGLALAALALVRLGASSLFVHVPDPAP